MPRGQLMEQPLGAGKSKRRAPGSQGAVVDNLQKITSDSQGVPPGRGGSYTRQNNELSGTFIYQDSCMTDGISYFQRPNLRKK